MNPKRLWLMLPLILLLSLTSGQTASAAPIAVGYPQLSGGSMPLWVIAENHLDQKYGVDVKPSYIAGGAIAGSIGAGAISGGAVDG